jgi:hypothetical protein
MFLFVLLLVGTVGLTLAWSFLIPNRGSRGRRFVRGLVASVATYGAVTLLAQILVVPWGRELVGPDVEWPVGSSGRVVRDSQGRYVVPHPSSSRVQVYDANLQFERGWFVETDSGSWKVRIADGDRIEVLTARGGRRLQYGPDGTLLEQGPIAPEEYADIPTGPTITVDVGTPWVLRPFAHPFYGMGMLFLGVIALAVLDRLRPRGGGA